MKTVFAVIGFVVVALVVGTCVACNDDDDSKDSFGPIQIVSRTYDHGGYDDGGDCWDEYDCRGREYGPGDSRDRYDQNYGSRDDRNRNRHRNRGAFSPGPFDRSPVTIIICPPGTQYCGSDGGRGQDQPPPDEQRAQSISCLIPLPYHCDQKPEEEL